MKIHWVFCLVILTCLACSLQSGPEHSNNSQNDFFWLLGDWQRTNDDEGKKTFESWKQVNDSTCEGIGWTMMGEDTVFKEVMTLLKGKRFVVDGANVDGTVVFEMSESTDSSFAVINPENEFPVRIEYIRTTTGLRAIISGESTEILFDFVANSSE
jgi:hypothetical protein